ncbi:hypothetical protein [uncultured Agitococcus sp.]|uniref:hypothetical protein n=1 Tax=uncultured Agitococcus sp. TaxID=1506599 RepID=UPI0026185F30|nr:hypothetical protein [uncultured Agitococcus sp.]
MANSECLTRVFGGALKVTFVPNGSQEATVRIEPNDGIPCHVSFSTLMDTTFSCFSSIPMSNEIRQDIRLWCKSCLDNTNNL